MTLHNVYFSGKGTTKACAQSIKNAMGLNSKPYPWAKTPPRGVIDIPAGVELVVGSLVVDGVELSSGRYSDTEGSARSHFKSGGGTLVVRGPGVKIFVK
jgi:hypothetical protein